MLREVNANVRLSTHTPASVAQLAEILPTRPTRPTSRVTRSCLHTSGADELTQEEGDDPMSNVSYYVGKIFQSQLTFSVELTAI